MGAWGPRAAPLRRRRLGVAAGRVQVSRSRSRRTGTGEPSGGGARDRGQAGCTRPGPRGGGGPTAGRGIRATWTGCTAGPEPVQVARSRPLGSARGGGTSSRIRKGPAKESRIAAGKNRRKIIVFFPPGLRGRRPRAPRARRGVVTLRGGEPERGRAERRGAGELSRPRIAVGYLVPATARGGRIRAPRGR